MSSDTTSQGSESNRLGFWIFAFVAAFTIGYPFFLFSVFEPHPLLLAVGTAFVFLMLFTGRGHDWARVLSALLSGLVAILLLGMLALSLDVVGDRFPETWPIFVIVPVLPLVGFGATFVLLSFRAVKVWQQSVRDRRREGITAGEPQSREPAALPTGTVLEPCPWCGAVAVNPTEEYCLSCRRPAG